ncbi:Uncharacterised protein [Mycobacteroides abscessus subsp. abscessus]|nr:Uncharacterised protein [Mycobacteroides abscessus subsp. abscessus]
MANVIPTWLTGLFDNVWISRSGPERPRNTQISPVRVASSASPIDTLACSVMLAP